MEKRKYVAPQMEVFNMETAGMLALSIDKGEHGPNVPEAPRMEFFDDDELLDDDYND